MWHSLFLLVFLLPYACFIISAVLQPHKNSIPGTSLAVQMLRFHTSTVGSEVWSVVWELRSHMLQDTVTKNINKILSLNSLPIQIMYILQSPAEISPPPWSPFGPTWSSSRLLSPLNSYHTYIASNTYIKFFASSHNSIKMYTSILSVCSISNFDDFYIELLAFFSTKKLALGCSEHHISPPPRPTTF